MSRARSLIYWGTTVLVALVLSSGGLFQILKQQGALEGLTSIGYPAYFATILGVWKLLGGIVLVAPRMPRLKEWAYAGAFFDLSGAALSHAAHGSAAGHVVWPFGLCVLAIVSWASRPASRVLGTLFRADGSLEARAAGATRAVPHSVQSML